MEEKRISNTLLLQQDALQAVYFLFGKIIVRKINNDIIRKRITEVEVYKQDDSACHAFKGKTKRNAPLFGDAGTIYVYLCYGLHNIVNIVTGENGNAQGIMLRGLDNTFGSGKVGKILHANLSLNFQNITTSDELWLEDDGFIVNPKNVITEKRIGISYAKEEDQNKLWRFRLKGF